MIKSTKDNLHNFLQDIRGLNLKSVERAIALLWWYYHHNNINVGIKEICNEINKAGYGKQNITRLKTALKKDRRTISDGDNFKISLSAVDKLDAQFMPILKNKPVKKSDAILDLNLFKNTRGYIYKVVLQVNRSYEESLFDCCTVMVRRLLETLIIEIYEKEKRVEEIKDEKGYFLMFSGLLNILENDKKINMGRQTTTALKNLKRIADSSAHNRRFNAIKKDIDDIKQDIQLSTNELLQLAFN